MLLTGTVGVGKTTFAAASPFDCTFDRCGWFGVEVLWLAPDRDQEFRDLTNGVVSAFPAYPPYGSEHDGVIPHLTVGDSRRGAVDDLRAAEVYVSGKLRCVDRLSSQACWCERTGA